ncbi:DUF5302 domain-containing protein [Kitasatospora cheerisanensis]|uniref:DUF5302 domain-containing protein n=1 Tax=Kitasatospora cheerisanensis TaxID=81942 RepID=UPI001431403D
MGGCAPVPAPVQEVPNEQRNRPSSRARAGRHRRRRCRHRRRGARAGRPEGQVPGRAAAQGRQQPGRRRRPGGDSKIHGTAGAAGGKRTFRRKSGG